MSTLKVNTVESASTPTVLISDGLSVTGVSTLSGGLKVGTAVIEDCAVTTALDTAVLIAFAVLVAVTAAVDTPLPISCPVALCELVALIIV